MHNIFCCMNNYKVNTALATITVYVRVAMIVTWCYKHKMASDEQYIVHILKHLPLFIPCFVETHIKYSWQECCHNEYLDLMYLWMITPWFDILHVKSFKTERTTGFLGSQNQPTRMSYDNYAWFLNIYYPVTNWPTTDNISFDW